ncbi:hypothetical protein DFH09DRAFT_1299696 [Mycena vulgaris]|nr:hypothetical protein DFH09DRAFT_1299696 [Mycena vulgaris]
MDTNLSGRSSTYLASATSSVSGLDGEGGEDTDGSAGRNRRSETTTVEMWPASSPSSARKPVNGSRLALAMQPPDSEESEEEEGRDDRRARGSSSEREDYDPDGGGWANVPLGGTLPLQVVKVNTAGMVPPSPYQPFPSSSSRSQNDDESEESRSRSNSLHHPDSSPSPMETDSESDYNPTDPEDHDGETTKFSPPSERRSGSPTSDDGSTQGHHPTPSISESVSSRSFTRPPSSVHDGSMLYGNTANFLMHEESTRLSIASPSLHGSDDGEVGIGLSLLQGMMGGDADGSDDDEEEHSTSSALTTPSAKESVTSSAQRQSVVSAGGSVPRQEDWDGASDIYEDYYRFSRFSTNPRSSTSTYASTSGKKMSARFSHSSQRGGMPVVSNSVVPPVPVDPRNEAESSRSLKRRSVDSEASVYTQASKASSIDPSRLSAQPNQSRRPAPLELGNVNGEPSPLLHTRWGSPISSASPPSSSAAGQSTFFDSGTALGSASSGSISPGGAASMLRQRLEIDRGSPGSNYTDLNAQEGDGLGRRIVIEDDEEPPAPSITDVTQYESPEEGSDMDLDDDPPAGRAGLDSLSPLVITESLSPPPGNSTTTTASTSPRSPLSTAMTTPISPSSPPDLAPPPQQTTQQQQHSQHQARPSLSELRGYAGHDSSSTGTRRDTPGKGSRTSIFLPHPNAPKPPPATGAAEGPMYIRAPPPPSQQRSENVYRTTHAKPLLFVACIPGLDFAFLSLAPSLFGKTSVQKLPALSPRTFATFSAAE